MRILATKTVTTRKEHRCDGCLRTFPAGSEMHTQSIQDGGRVYTWRTCQECVYLVDLYCREDAYGDGCPEGFRYELCGHTNEELSDACLCQRCKANNAPTPEKGDDGAQTNGN